ncbi:hypothetical protein ACFQJ7_10515 [Halovenus rubra]|uniref:DUF8080 domain-containing protein n=2 Tax=Halovenus rubra TaxID=869890 RepID=A0ABD5X970_9EURY|nr:hypothetical protein [Halovenus rubra]
MATLDWQLEDTGAVTLVELSVRSDRTKQVRIESRLQPVWPPRQQGVPARGWNDSSFEGTVHSGEPLVVGYATPASPVEPPAEITDTGSPTQEPTVTPETIVRTLGDSRPPRETLSKPEQANSLEESGTVPMSERPHVDRRVATAGTGTTQDSVTPTTDTDTDGPIEWFEAVEKRVATTEQLAETTDADEIRTAVDEAGGIGAVRELQAQLDADRQHIQEVQRRSEALADQLSAVELPLSTLERVV